MEPNNDSSKKRKIINFKVQLNDEQKLAKQEVLNTPITLIDGSAGSGKTTLASQIALDLLFNKEIDKIVIARPFITAGEDIGYLPGGVDQKLEYLTSPIYEVMDILIGNKEKSQKLNKGIEDSDEDEKDLDKKYDKEKMKDRREMMGNLLK